MWYYKQNFIRKSVWHGHPRVLCKNLEEVICWLRSMAAATGGAPLPADALEKLERVYTSTCQLVEEGHVLGR
jgi:hypothetical protein